ncbi:MAG: hypothetical protein M5U28_44860 [Sandaracinaceae bacterium]|nr:hypothetical protein [Sandaracinaceae bacterium]
MPKNRPETPWIARPRGPVRAYQQRDREREHGDPGLRNEPEHRAEHDEHDDRRQSAQRQRAELGHGEVRRRKGAAITAVRRLRQLREDLDNEPDTGQDRGHAREQLDEAGYVEQHEPAEDAEHAGPEDRQHAHPEHRREERHGQLGPEAAFPLRVVLARLLRP